MGDETDSFALTFAASLLRFLMQARRLTLGTSMMSGALDRVAFCYDRGCGCWADGVVTRGGGTVRMRWDGSKGEKLR